MPKKITATEAMRQEYYRIINDASSDGITRHDAIKLATEQVSALIDAGWVHEPDRDDALKLVARRYDEAQGKTADSIMAALAAGESSTPVPPTEIQRTIVTLGSGKRKTWRYVTAADIDSMTDERTMNVRRQQQAMRAWKTHAHSISPVIREHGTVGDALDASALPLVS